MFRPHGKSYLDLTVDATNLLNHPAQPTAIAPSTASRLGTMPLTFSLGVNGLALGAYECQVTILDPAAEKADYWRAPIVLVP